MEAIGAGLAAIGGAIGTVAIWAGLSCIAALGATTFLIYTEKISLTDIKDFFKKDKRW